MNDFDYHQPQTLAEAAAIMRASRDGAFLAGGMSLIPALKARRARPSDLVDLRLIDEMNFIRREGDNIVVGAMTKHTEVASSEIVRAAIPDLARLVGEMADPSVRNRATLGGSIAHADPAADYAPALVALGASVVTAERSIAAERFFTGPFTTALRKGEVVTAVRFPLAECAAYAKFANTASRYAIVGVFVARGTGTVRVAVTGARPCVFRHARMEAALEKSFTPEAVKDIVTDPRGLTADIHGTPEYRAHLIGVMAARAVASALRHQRA
ncbi:MAG: xanthine dehydrogenase family protein subunit M [Xanthobacteraceae bacterium]